MNTSLLLSLTFTYIFQDINIMYLNIRFFSLYQSFEIVEQTDNSQWGNDRDTNICS